MQFFDELTAAPVAVPDGNPDVRRLAAGCRFPASGRVVGIVSASPVTPEELAAFVALLAGGRQSLHHVQWAAEAGAQVQIGWASNGGQPRRDKSTR